LTTVIDVYTVFWNTFARKNLKKLKDIFLSFPFQTIFLYEGAFYVRERWTTHSLGLIAVVINMFRLPNFLTGEDVMCNNLKLL
jgi:hypothetical protein